VRSDDLEGGRDLVRVHAKFLSSGRNDMALEQAVSRLSLEPSAASVSWTVDDGLDVEEE
jgi:hypothetical protein